MYNKNVTTNQEKKKRSKIKYLILISIFTTFAITIGIMTCVYDNVVMNYADDMKPWGYWIPDDPTDKTGMAFPNSEYMDYIHSLNRYQYYRRSWGYTLCGIFAIADAVVVMSLIRTNRKHN